MEDPKAQFMFSNGALHFGPYDSFREAAVAATEYAEGCYEHATGYVDWTKWPTLTIAPMVRPTKPE